LEDRFAWFAENLFLCPASHPFRCSVKGGDFHVSINSEYTFGNRIQGECSGSYNVRSVYQTNIEAVNNVVLIWQGDDANRQVINGVLSGAGEEKLLILNRVNWLFQSFYQRRKTVVGF